MKPLVTLKPFLHKSGEKIGIYFENYESINTIIRKKGETKWSCTGKCWHVPLNEKSYKQICLILKDKVEINNSVLKKFLDNRKHAKPISLNKVEEKIIQSVTPVTVITKLPNKISKENLEALNKFIQQLTLKAYGASTIRSYRNEFMQLLQTIKNKPVQELTPDDLKRYMVYCFEKLKLTENTLHSRLNALKFFFEQVLKKEKYFLGTATTKKTISTSQNI